MFRVRDLDSGDWIVKGDDGELSPTQHKNVATVFKTVAWVRYWQDKEGVEIVPLTETEIMAMLPPAIAPRLPGFEEGQNINSDEATALT